MLRNIYPDSPRGKAHKNDGSYPLECNVRKAVPNCVVMSSYSIRT
jgi:hypothetical protein